MKVFIGFVLLAFALTSCVGQNLYPYHVKINIGSRHWCSGSIINKNWVLTTAQCLFGKAKLYNVVVGTSSLGHGTQEQTYRPHYFVRHEDYNIATRQNNIGLIRLLGGLEFNDNVQPIDLSSEDVGRAGYPTTLTGWSISDLLGRTANDLQQGDLDTISLDQCRSKLFGIVLTDTNICTSRREEDTCIGDDGAPLVVNGQQVGIMNRIHPCAKGLPDVFTKVSHYIDWINSKTKF